METRIGDIVLVYHLNNPVFYARVEEILADMKPGWWQLRMLVLQVPTREVVWTLRDEYIDGGEFTMGGEAMRLERLPRPEQVVYQDEEPEAEEKPAPEDEEDTGSKVVNLADRFKKK